jgi:hypothetical protein
MNSGNFGISPNLDLPWRICPGGLSVRKIKFTRLDYIILNEI